MRNYNTFLINSSVPQQQTAPRSGVDVQIQRVVAPVKPTVCVQKRESFSFRSGRPCESLKNLKKRRISLYREMPAFFIFPLKECFHEKH